jgi:hypothetical protein
MLPLFQNGERLCKPSSMHFFKIRLGHLFLPILLKTLWDASGCLRLKERLMVPLKDIKLVLLQKVFINRPGWIMERPTAQ